MSIAPGGSIYFPTAVPGRRGLLAVTVALAQSVLAEGGQPEAERWVNGFTAVPDSCDSADPIGIGCVDSPVDKLPVDNADNVDVHPFLTLGSDTCSTMDRGRDWLGRATRNLLATESWQAEAELFDGAASKGPGVTPNPFFTDGATATDATAVGGAMAAIRALARLEGALAACLHGQRGMIHATPELVSQWDAGGALRVEGSTVLTVLDTIVVAGSGYSGNDPDGTPATAGTTWAYGTPLIYGLQGSVRPVGDQPQSTDRAQNTITRIVERPNALVFATCCVLAVHASLTT